MFQIIGGVLIALFYIAYFTKMFHQHKRGIQTNQLGVGKKEKRTLYIENTLRFLTSAIVLVMFVSILLNTSMISNVVIRWIGIGIIAAGVFIFIVAMVTMQDNWRAGIPTKERLEIVTKGIYGFSRNPAFVGFDLTYIGACVAFGNYILFAFSIGAIICMHFQILEEEKYMEETFGKSYLNYKMKVRRYLGF